MATPNAHDNASLSIRSQTYADGALRGRRDLHLLARVSTPGETVLREFRLTVDTVLCKREEVAGLILY